MNPHANDNADNADNDVDTTGGRIIVRSVLTPSRTKNQIRFISQDSNYGSTNETNKAALRSLSVVYLQQVSRFERRDAADGGEAVRQGSGGSFRAISVEDLTTAGFAIQMKVLEIVVKIHVGRA